ncbi:MAG: hypothetical protein NZM18_13050 [Thermoflexales bacterium]|nr:hypothetical protein [Thermoflexales bacterium]MDW8351954.1 hypothetical protein [Anaerolineae bacterium]
MTIALIGILASLAMMIFGLVVIGRRGELAVEQSSERVREARADVGAGVEDAGVGAGVQVSYFRGVSKGFALYAEKSTAEILDMVRAGRWSEAWPWLMVALGLQMLFLWIPLLFGLLVGWSGLGLWAFVGLFFFGALFAAFPRRS